MNELIKTFDITTNSLDCFNYLKPSSILDYTQCVAGLHADLLNVGYDDFIKKDLIWVIIRNKFDIIQDIKNPKKISIKTSLVKTRLFECPRDYEIYLDDILAIKGRSIWAIYNIKTNNIILPNEYNQLITDNIGLFQRIKKIPNISKDLLKYCDDFKVTFSYLDHNKHMNNTRYLDLFLDINNLKEDEKIKSFQVEYISQCYLNETISLYSYKEESTKYLFGFDKKDQLKFYIKADF